MTGAEEPASRRQSVPQRNAVRRGKLAGFGTETAPFPQSEQYRGEVRANIQERDATAGVNTGPPPPPAPPAPCTCRHAAAVGPRGRGRFRRAHRAVLRDDGDQGGAGGAAEEAPGPAEEPAGGPAAGHPDPDPPGPPVPGAHRRR